METLTRVPSKSDLYGLQKVNIDQLVYCIKDNTFYHLRDISRSNKTDGWEQVAAIPKNTIAISTPTGAYLTQSVADLRYVQYQNINIKPDQTIYGNVNIVGNITATGEISAFTATTLINWWDSMPYAQSGVNAHVGGIKVGSNLTIDINGYLNANIAGGAGTWGSIGGDIVDQLDLVAAFNLKSDTIHNLIDTTNHPVSGLTTGQFLRALSATTYGFESVSAVLAYPTPIINQIGIWVDETTLKGVEGLKYDGSTLSITGNITATGEISAFTGSAPDNWWNSMPSPTTTIRGGILLDGNTSHFFRGDGTWEDVTSGTFVHSELSSLDYASSGHIGFAPLASPVFTGSIVTPHIYVRETTTSYGYIGMTHGDGTHSGYVEWYKSGPIRLGYMGWNNTNLGLAIESGSFSITGGNTGIECTPIYTLDINGIIGLNGGYSAGSPTPNNTSIGTIIFTGSGNDYIYSGASIWAKTITGGNQNRWYHTTDLIFETKNNTANTSVERMRILANGGVCIATSTVRANSILDIAGGLATGREGIMGTYNSAQIQGIWSISPSYVVSIASNNGGNAYGLGYAYENTGFGFTGYGHQICFLGNGTNYASISMNTGKSYFAGAMYVNSSISGISFKTTNFSIEESGTSLIIKYGATVIGSISNAGYLKMKDEISAFTTSIP
jgi:hypothetical protein